MRDDAPRLSADSAAIPLHDIDPHKSRRFSGRDPQSPKSEPDPCDASREGQSRPADSSEEEKDEVDADESDDAETGRLLQESEGYDADTVRAKAGTRSEEDAAEMVRRVVPETDDTSLPTLTPRVLILGTILCIFGASISQLFFFKSNAPSFSSFFIILISYPLGKWFDKLLPRSLQRGPFGKKEHMLIGILAGSGASAAYAGEIVSVQSLYYQQDLGTFGGLLLLLSTQLIGFGLSGLTYAILVRPTVMVWPAQLVTVALYETLHGGSKDQIRQAKDRLRFFLKSFAGIFTWQFFPTVIAPTLSSIALLCIINNRSSIMRVLGSGYDGFGMFDFSLDWAVVGGTGALYTPFFAQCSFFAGQALNLWFLTPLMYFGFDFWNAQSFDSPVGAHLYNGTFGRMDVLDILNEDLSLNEQRYAEVGPLQLTPYFALTYGVSFALLTSALSTILLWHVGDIRKAIAASFNQTGDVHVEQLERNYAPVPRSYYVGVFVFNLIAAIFLLVNYPLQLPVWGLFLALAIAIIFLVPIGIISAITNTTLGLNVVTEFVAGWIWPGKPLANITFKVYGYMAMLQSIELSSDQCLALYMKIPPRDLFICQVYGTALGSIVNFVLIQGVIAAKRPYLDGTLPDPTQQWTGRKPEIFFSASVIFGVLAPKRFFDGQYRVLYWGFLIGAILPVIPWYLYRRTGRPIWRQVNVPLVLHGSIGPPQTPMNVLVPGFIVSFLSQFYALRYRPRWFDKYNYTLSAALDAGTSVQAIIVYMLSLDNFVTWWGNSAIDSEHCIPGS
ncbi:hypothetical protein C6P46_005682 [Rhodotorula mucilaginosa]|uniref:OPT family small oligopeptide transporter n=1 Tax=Rhodotorula mucilaginosa TaxID=5537 RepID=A0A9P6W026_RHOMI|nr:hypothetical protein C6P46_005682 [Rhodotorula mucilaginosa]